MANDRGCFAAGDRILGSPWIRRRRDHLCSRPSYWRLNDSAGSATARDSSGWGNDGTLVGIDLSTAWVAGGPEGGALSDQGMGYVNVPSSTSINSITTQVTIAAWI